MNPTFDELYLYFSETYLTPARTKKDCDLIEQLCTLKKGDLVLDIGCGHGRISEELTRRGYCLTGIDWSQSAIALARTNACAQQLLINYINGSFLDAILPQTFDCVLSWYTSFGYGSDSDCILQLEKIYELLKPGGRVIIDHINRDLCLKNLPTTSVHERNNNFMIDSFHYHSESGHLHTHRRFSKNGHVTDAPYNIRLFPFTELKSWLSHAKFKNIKGFDNQGKPFIIDSNRMIIFGVK
jgi:SAM-dependent methyltransferase